MNVSGAGVAKYSKNKANAIKFIEFLTSKEAQGLFSESNYEYPVNPEVEESKLLNSWGEFKEDDINLSKLGEYNKEAVKLFNKVGWK
jgi:iron(III) transport system substrate-binding protein